LRYEFVGRLFTASLFRARRRKCELSEPEARMGGVCEWSEQEEIEQHILVFVCRECRLRQLLPFQEKLPKMGNPKSSSCSDFWRICASSFCYWLREPWHSFNYTGVQLVNYIEHDTIVWQRIFILYHVLEFRIQKVLHSPLKTNLYFTSPISRSTSSFVEKKREGIPNSPPPVHLWGKKRWNFSQQNIKTNCFITKHTTYQCWQLPLEKRGIHFFPKMSTAPLFLLIPTPHPVKSSFCTGVQFSRDPIRAFNDQIKIWENRRLWTV